MSNLTDAIIKKLPLPETGNKIYYDDPPGFGCRITAAGAKAFLLNYRVQEAAGASAGSPSANIRTGPSERRVLKPSGCAG